jgi:hypothetical protein
MTCIMRIAAKGRPSRITISCTEGLKLKEEFWGFNGDPERFPSGPAISHTDCGCIGCAIPYLVLKCLQFFGQPKI